MRHIYYYAILGFLYCVLQFAIGVYYSQVFKGLVEGMAERNASGEDLRDLESLADDAKFRAINGALSFVIPGSFFLIIIKLARAEIRQKKAASN